jgi:hypothetical protein
MAVGTHARIYRTRERGDPDSPFYCIKLFRRGWMTPFNLERTAYEHIQAARIDGYIPEVFGYDYRTLPNWGLPFGTEDDQLYYAIVMEWVEGAEQVSPDNISVPSACMLLNGLGKIHGAGVLHNDTFKRNLMVVPDKDRGVWTDFSCAHMGEETHFGGEMMCAQGIICTMVSGSSTFAHMTSFMKEVDVKEHAR